MIFNQVHRRSNSKRKVAFKNQITGSSFYLTVSKRKVYVNAVSNDPEIKKNTVILQRNARSDGLKSAFLNRPFIFGHSICHNLPGPPTLNLAPYGCLSPKFWLCWILKYVNWMISEILKSWNESCSILSFIWIWVRVLLIRTPQNINKSKCNLFKYLHKCWCNQSEFSKLLLCTYARLS